MLGDVARVVAKQACSAMLAQGAEAALVRLRHTLEAVPKSFPQLAAQVVLRQRIEEALQAQVPHASLRQAMIQTFAEMLQGMGHGFRVLQGGRTERRTPRALSSLHPSHALLFPSVASSC